jgi:hypothetical protein
MKVHTVFILICLSLTAPSAFAQSNGPTGAMAASPAVPEEARKHFVMGTTLFKDAKTADDFVQVEGEFKQAADLAPQWPDPRYNLALAKEAAGDYSGAMADLKLYQQFKLSDSEARTVLDKIYALEAKAEVAAKKRIEKTESDTTKQNEQQIVDLQRNFPDLIHKLDGATFVGSYHGHREKINFLRKPLDVGTNPPTAFNATPYIWLQYNEDDDNKHPSVVMPTSATTFYVTSAFFPTDLDKWPDKKSVWTISQDGQSLSRNDDSGAQYFTKK